MNGNGLLIQQFITRFKNNENLNVLFVNGIEDVMIKMVNGTGVI
jgi:hypothetical protein